MFEFLFDKVTEQGNSYIIRNFPYNHFRSRLKRFYGTSKIVNIFSGTFHPCFSNNHSVTIHKFFIPELVYLLEKFHYPQALINIIVDNTWIRGAIRGDVEVLNRIRPELITKHMNVELKNYQQEFIAGYDLMKQRYHLNGCILSFEQGLGKTVTSLALMTALSKKKVIIICPKSTMDSVWKEHIDKFFKEPKKVFMVNQDELNQDYDFYIFNYESMDKLEPEIENFAKNNADVGVIVDESHNFLRKSSNRTQNLIQLRSDLKCSDMLLMSGTPLKALGVDIIPMLFVLDNLFDESAMEIYKAALGVNTTAATDIIKNRLSIMMHRKLKEDVLKLPDKYEENILVKIPEGADYCVDKVKQTVKLFIIERKKFHNEHMNEYLAQFTKALDYLRNRTSLNGTADFHIYLDNIALFRKWPVDLRDPVLAAKVKWTNEYELKTIMPLLPKDLKNGFKDSRSAVKYVHLKIRGEVIGQLLTNMRIKMTSSMLQNCDLKSVIDDAEKKTILFTSYVDTVETAITWAKTHKYKALAIYGETAHEVKETIHMFNNDPQYNPLIASLQMVATGVTLTAANTTVFTNKPWRFNEYIQACDRTHRIGQDMDCFFYTLILDTGEDANLSTKMEEVMAWSKDMFDGMVNTKTA